MYEARQNKEKVSRTLFKSLNSVCQNHKAYQTEFISKPIKSSICKNNHTFQFMTDAYNANPGSFDNLMGSFPYKSIKQALRYRTIAEAKVNGIELGMSFSNKAYGDSDHAEDAIIDTMEIIMDLYFSQPQPSKFTEIINSIRNTPTSVLEISISASPCERCRQRIKEFRDLYGFQVRIIYHHLYKDPNGATKSSNEGMQELSRAGIPSIQDKELIQR